MARVGTVWVVWTARIGSFLGLRDFPTAEKKTRHLSNQNKVKREIWKSTPKLWKRLFLEGVKKCLSVISLFRKSGGETRTSKSNQRLPKFLRSKRVTSQRGNKKTPLFGRNTSWLSYTYSVTPLEDWRCMLACWNHLGVGWNESYRWLGGGKIAKNYIIFSSQENGWKPETCFIWKRKLIYIQLIELIPDRFVRFHVPLGVSFWKCSSQNVCSYVRTIILISFL